MPDGRGPPLAVRRSRARRAGGGAVEEDGALACVAGQRGGALELGARLLVAAEPGQQVAADAGQEMVAAQLRPAGQRVDELEAPLWAEGHGDGDRAVELHHRG